MYSDDDYFDRAHLGKRIEITRRLKMIIMALIIIMSAWMTELGAVV